MKRIGIITYHRAFSYGAQLQAYALATFLCEKGFHAEVIDYSNIGEGKRPKISFHNFKIFVKTFISYVLSIPNEDLRRKRFSEFLNKYIPKSSKRYLTNESLEGIEDLYDYFITGSDQVWCPIINLGDKNFLLDFVKSPKKKIAYAASFGVSELPLDIFEEYKKCLSNFKQILIRETAGQELIEKMLGLKPEIVLDPTFLIPVQKWEEMAIFPLKNDSPYILCFKIITASPIYDQYIKELHKQTGYRIIHIESSYRYKPINGTLYSTGGPRELLGLIKNASVIVTNSFHGTVFSILFHKPFYTALNDNGRNSRMIELARRLHLSDRLFDSNSPMPSIDKLDIDYDAISPIIESETNRSQNLLLNALNQ